MTSYGVAASAAEQRAYFQECIKRQGKMDDGGAAPDNAADRHRPM